MSCLLLSGSELEQILGTADYAAWNEVVDNRFFILIKLLQEKDEEIEDLQGQLDSMSGRVGSVEDDVGDLRDQIDTERVTNRPPK